MSLPYHHTVASPPLSPLVPQRGPHFEQSEKTHYQEKDEQPPRLVASPTDYVADELPRRQTIDSSNQVGHELKIYPLSSIALIAWTIYIVVLFWLCEKAVAVSKTSVKIPWAYSTLPSLLLTIFAQAHSPLTALHLGRLAVSSLQHSFTQPRSWAELFWLADGNWKSPLGIFSALKGARALKTSLSVTIMAFSVTSLVALVTPIVLSHAYPVGTVIVPVYSEFNPVIFSPSALSYGDAYVQMAIGLGGWTTGQTVQGLYNSSIYQPSSSLDGPGKFYSGIVGDREARVPGLLFDGGCTSLPPSFSHNIVNTPEQFNITFDSFCSNAVSSPGARQFSGLFVSNGEAYATLSYCSSTDYFTPLVMDNTTQLTTTTSAYIFLNTSTPSTAVAGLFNCTSSISAGAANVSGPLGTYSSYQPSPVHFVLGDEQPMDPMMAFLYNIVKLPSVVDQVSTSVVQALGLVTANTLTPDGDEVYYQPTLDELARNLGSGIEHTAAGTMLLAQTQNATYNSTQRVPTTGRTRNVPFVRGAIVLIVLWFVFLVLATAALGRRTFGDGLSSYVTARLFVGMGELVEGQSCGDMSKNARLGAAFSTVGDGAPHGEQGVIELGGRGPLKRGRSFM